MIEKLIVFRDSSGKVINIGDWIYFEELLESGEIIQHNPLPDNVKSQIEEVQILEDGSRVAIDN